MFVKENKSEGRNCKSAIALTCILDKHFAKAVSLLEDMKQQRSLTTARDHFLLYKAYVLLGDDLKSSATIKDMMEADDFHGDYLTLSATEAINASLNKVGIKCLQNLLRINSDNGRHYALICRNLIRLMLQEDESKAEILTVFESISELAVSKGANIVLGLDSELEKECTWFAYHAYNCGLDCISIGCEKNEIENWKLASRYFGISKKFASIARDACTGHLEPLFAWSCFWNALGINMESLRLV